MNRLATVIILLATAACTSVPESRIVFITATPSTVPAITAVSEPTPESDSTALLLDLGLEAGSAGSATRTHVVAAGETLFAIADRYATSLETLIELNQLENPNLLFVGQQLTVPGGPVLITPSLELLPEGLLVRGPSSPRQVIDLVGEQPAYLTSASDAVEERSAEGDRFNRTQSAVQVVDRVSAETSVDARVLLAFLEYRAGWLTQAAPANTRDPLIDLESALPVNRSGIYRQVAWLANELNRGYYAHKYGQISILELEDGTRLQIDPSLNSESVAVMRALSLGRTPAEWLADISLLGWRATYSSLFGEPAATARRSWIVPEALSLPYARGETWLFTGGPHGGWGSGSAWAALDFAPPDESRNRLCFISAFPARASAAGVVAYRDAGMLVLDLDLDGDDRTGWSLMYLHLTTDSMPALGTRVAAGDVLGFPSCEGGVSTATHLHIARRFDGEWIPADCTQCPGGDAFSFALSSWRTSGIPDQEYQGQLARGTDVRVAEQTRSDPINRVTHE